MVTYTQLIGSSEVEVARPILAEVAATIADVQVRNRGTVGGNVCVSDPTNHLPPLLLALDASFTILGSDGERVVPADEFFVGVYVTAVGEGELLTKISVPPASDAGDGFSGVTIGRHGTYVVDAAAPFPTKACESRSGASQRPRCARPRWRSACREGDFSEETVRDAAKGSRRVTRSAVGRPRVGRLSDGSLAEISAVRAVLQAVERRKTVSDARTPSSSRTISLDVNGEAIEYEVPARRLLVHFIRDDLGLTGTHVGLRHGELRRLHDPSRRHPGEELHAAGGAGRRCAHRRRSRGSPPRAS